MTDLTPHATDAPAQRAPLLPVLALAVALLGVALGAVALALAATGDDTGTVRMPRATTEQMATMNERMATMGGTMRGGAMTPMAPGDVDAMRSRCVMMMGQLHQMTDATSFCDSMIRTMPMGNP